MWVDNFWFSLQRSWVQHDSTRSERAEGMQFAYDGFTQQDDVRCFRFHHVRDDVVKEVFQIEVGLSLFLQHRVLVQDGPRFCLELLNASSVANPSTLEHFHKYRVVSTDFSSLLAERARLLAAKQLRTKLPVARQRRVGGSYAYSSASVVRP